MKIRKPKALLKHSGLLFCCLLAFTAFSQSSKPISIIPQPVSLTKSAGQFTLPTSVIIGAVTSSEMLPVTTYLKNKIAASTGKTVLVKSNASFNAIKLVLNKTEDPVIGKEGYQLNITTSGIIIKANQPAGLFYGVQTLMQLLPKEIESKTVVENVKWTVPFVKITDYPRFGWRGLMFDVARHFFTKQEVKQYIDAMVRYKYNLLHLHLTDDEGWRIEIKGLPKLTEVGAWSAKRVGYFGTFAPPAPDEPRTYGGFYTQEDIKELVKYAQDRFVNILPEIDVPGHSLAAIASYPELSCTPGAENYKVRSGEEIMDWSHGAPPIALVDNTLCPANEKVYTFLDTVITQIARLFPFEYIHLGGDECPKNFWEKSSAIKALMQKEGLKNMPEVQSYFEKRVEKIVESKGKRFMGWDEILEGGLAPNAVVMSWRGMKGGTEAAKMGHEVVMSPTTFAYLDYMQGDQSIEAKVYATLRLQKAYEFEPVPDDVDAKLIKGGQANLWTEQVYNMRKAEYMVWPRGFAIAETLWSPKATKNWDDFAARAEAQFPRLETAEINYAPSMYDPIINVSRTDSAINVALSTEIKGLDIYYSFDNSFPDRFYPKYTQPLTVPKEAAQLKVITYRGKEPIGRMMNITIDDLNARLPKKK
ncbi:beta-N-acetylhexosaminidase [Mucilaginibacter arboris]|uniref:beta-N-acetylhexosaminidase n=1 Tax=Mucilaginibacter arboris TaxID=2682090 RepID=A0A7K1SY21_9SPHI|nr:family 20 glycosylhydrolase [Mucilaginibacter arboris]MVN22203.1 family 20 glycosylhydrolase [Mucilaginibacter arboris]